MRRIVVTCSLIFFANAVLANDALFVDYDFSKYSQEVTECDRLTAHGRDPGHVAPPVTRDGMNKPAAIAACLTAVENDPENPRLNYQLGRAYGYSGQGEKAMPYRRKALEAEYPQSTFVIGYLHLIGVTIEQDTCRALSLWRSSARHRRLAALVSLPRHYMRGDFDVCDVEISNTDLRAYLEAAKEQSSDYYVGLLVTDLLEDVTAREQMSAK